MKAQDFLAWTEATGLTTARQVSEALGASRNKVQLWFADAEQGKDLNVKRVDALAMTAIFHNMSPWDER
jgi:TRAP-type uncharacterized transport system substrate-binding protein